MLARRPPTILRRGERIRSARASMCRVSHSRVCRATHSHALQQTTYPIARGGRPSPVRACVANVRFGRENHICSRMSDLSSLITIYHLLSRFVAFVVLALPEESGGEPHDLYMCPHRAGEAPPDAEAPPYMSIVRRKSRWRSVSRYSAEAFVA
jgi:hypothetical protein